MSIERKGQVMIEFLKKFRADIEALWDEETCSAKFLPINPNNPAAGQCTPTSYVLLHELRKEFPDRYFTHAIGTVQSKDGVLIELHLWVMEVFDNGREAWVIDVTGDQSSRLPTVICESTIDLANRGVYYVCNQQSDTSEFLHDDARRRSDLLVERYRGQSIVR